MIEFAIVAIATWRLSSLFARETGPFNLFGRIRIFLFKKSLNSVLFQTLSDGIACMWCNSIWFASLLSLTISSSLMNWIINTLAISGLVIFIEIVYGGFNGNSKNKNTT